MKVAVVGYRKNYFEAEIKKEKDLKLTGNNPDVVIAFGGEGTFLYSEMKYPGVPKVFAVHSSRCRKCSHHNYKKIINALVEKKFKISEHVKVQASANGKTLVGLNDVNLHYKPPCALRFSLDIGKKQAVKECIGDGLIVSTPYGSSGYFFSITGKTFSRGLGIAFNNPVSRLKERIVPENSVIKVKIVRGPGVLCTDCSKKAINLNTGDTIKINKHANFARILKLNKKMKVIIW